MNPKDADVYGAVGSMLSVRNATRAQVEGTWKCYRQVLFQIFKFLPSIRTKIKNRNFSHLSYLDLYFSNDLIYRLLKVSSTFLKFLFFILIGVVL